MQLGGAGERGGSSGKFLLFPLTALQPSQSQSHTVGLLDDGAAAAAEPRGAGGGGAGEGRLREEKKEEKEEGSLLAEECG